MGYRDSYLTNIAVPNLQSLDKRVVHMYVRVCEECEHVIDGRLNGQAFGLENAERIQQMGLGLIQPSVGGTANWARLHTHFINRSTFIVSFKVNY